MAHKFVAGAYSATVGAVDIGNTQDGFDMSQTDMVEGVTIDRWGDAEVDGVYRGFNLEVSTRLSEWNAAGRDSIVSWYESVIGTMKDVGKLVVIGGLTKQLILTPIVAGTGQFTYTFPRAVIVGPRAWNMNNRLRIVTCSFKVYMDDSGVVYTRSGGA